MTLNKILRPNGSYQMTVLGADQPVTEQAAVSQPHDRKDTFRMMPEQIQKIQISYKGGGEDPGPRYILGLFGDMP